VLRTDWPSQTERFVVPAALGVGLLALLGVWFAGRPLGARPGFPLDDAWIHMVYGRGLLADGYFAYNPGTPATGCTAPVWAVLVALVHALLAWISVDAVVIGVILVGCALHLLTVWLVGDFAWRLTGLRAAGLAAATLLAVSGPLVGAAFSGMEVSLCGLLLVAGGRAWIRHHSWRAGLWLALAAATRPEAAVVVVLAVSLALGAAPVRAERRSWRPALALALPSAIVGLLLSAYYLSVSGRPLPATFYFKQAAIASDLPDRLWIAVTAMLDQVPPFVAGIGLAGFVGYLTTRPTLASAWPPLAGFGFLLANLWIVPPYDPRAFYHVRYILPAVPLLIVGTTVGAVSVVRSAPRVGGPVVIALFAAAAASGVVSLAPASRRLHSDARNINEVQRAMGLWLAEAVPRESWIAASDAGAVRYFSDRPTIDVMGLNTPELYWDRETYARDRPVAAMAIMPAWLQPVPDAPTKVYAVMQTEDYTVTSNPLMSRQTVLGCTGSGRVPVRFQGVRSFLLYCEAGRLESGPTAPGESR
jgi:hypothetical protein